MKHFTHGKFLFCSATINSLIWITETAESKNGSSTYALAICSNEIHLGNLYQPQWISALFKELNVLAQIIIVESMVWNFLTVIPLPRKGKWKRQKPINRIEFQDYKSEMQLIKSPCRATKSMVTNSANSRNTNPIKCKKSVQNSQKK